MAGFLPPAVQKFVADVVEYVEPVRRAAEETRRLADAGGIAAEAARVVERGERDAAVATRLAADAAKQLERADLAAAEAQLAAARAAQDDARAQLEAAAATDRNAAAARGAERSGHGMAATWASVIGLVASVAPAVAAASAGLAAFGAVAVPTLKKVFDAQQQLTKAQDAYNKAATSKQKLAALKQEHDAWASLNKPQQDALKNLQKLIDSFKRVQAAVQPQVLSVFADGLKIASDLMQYLAPLAKAAASALDTLLKSADKALGSPFWKQFFSMLQSQAKPSILAFGQLVGNLAQLFAALLQDLAPVAPKVLAFAIQVVKLATAFAQAHPKAVQFAAGVAMLAKPLSFITSGPVGIAVGVILALGAALYAAYRHSESFRKGVADLAKWFSQNVEPVLKRISGQALKALADGFNEVMQTVKDNKQQLKDLGNFIAKYVLPLLGPAMQGVIKNLVFQLQVLISTIGWLVRAFEGFLHSGQTTGRLIRSAFQSMRDGVSSAINSVIGLVHSVPGRIRSAFGNLGGLLWGAGHALINGLISGIEAAIPGLQGVLGWVTSMIPSWKGPLDVDARLLEPTGRVIMGGLVSGIVAGSRQVQAALGGVTAMIAGTSVPGLAGPAVVAPAAGLATLAGGGPTVVNVTVRGSVIAEDELRQIVQRQTLRYQKRNRTNGLAMLGVR